MVSELKKRPRPRSPSFTMPVAVMNTLAGLMSAEERDGLLWEDTWESLSGDSMANFYGDVKPHGKVPSPKSLPRLCSSPPFTCKMDLSHRAALRSGRTGILCSCSLFVQLCPCDKNSAQHTAGSQWKFV